MSAVFLFVCKSLACTIVLLSLVFIPRVEAEQGQKLTIYTEHFPPYSYQQNGRITGVNIDFVKLLCVEAQLQCRFRMLPWNRAFSMAQENPASGLVSVSLTQKRKPLFKWVGPLANDTSYFYKLRKRTDIIIDSIDDVKLYTTGVPRQDVYESVLANLGFSKGFNLLETSTKHESVKLLLKGKLELIIASPYVLPFITSSLEIDNSDLVATIPIPRIDMGGNHLALNKSVDDALVSELQRFSEQLKATGTIDKLQQTHRQALANH